MAVLDVYKNLDTPHALISWDKEELDLEMLEFEEIMEDNMWHTLRKISNLPANGSKHKVMF